MEIRGEDMAANRKGLERLGSQDYSEYLKRQVSKLALVKDWIINCEPRYRMELRERLQEFGAISPGMSVLCLGAQLGGEVKAFIDCGCFAVGLDLNPGEANRFVVHGDFHQIQFASNSVDVIFTNSIDHVFNLDIFIGEVCRVLKPGGLLIMDISRGRVAGHEPGDWESLWWQKVDDLLAPFLANRFDLLYKHDFEWPWPGQHTVLRAV